MQRERAPPRPEHQLNPLTTQSLGLGLKRSSGIVELAALDSDSPTSTAPTSTSPSPPSSTAPSSTGFEITSRLKAYRPPASLPASPPTPITPLPQGSLSHNPSGSSFRSRRSSPPAPFRISADAVASTSSHNPEAKTTHTLSSSVDDRGRRMVNQYVRLKTIGQGSHGKVWLCAEPNSAREDDERETSNSHEERGLEHDDDDLVYSAIKSVAREGGRGKSLRHAKGKKAAGTGGIGSDDQVKREVAIMKRLDHKNVVRLKEVIDDVKSKKVFMVLEFMAGGQIVWQNEHKQPTMTVDEARRTFRDVVLGLEYLHYQGIIHRDIKPANLLWTEDHSLVKISDFGVSHVSDALLRATPGAGAGEDDKALRMTAGSPAFFAPELCHPAEYTGSPESHPDSAGSYFGNGVAGMTSIDDGVPGMPGRRTSTVISLPLPVGASSRWTTRPAIGKGIDVWALGVTLYCLLFGDTPFMASTEYELYNVIVRESVRVPETMGREGKWTGVGSRFSGCGDGVEGREVVSLLSRLLEKDPAKRISLGEVKQHPWVLRNLASPKAWLSDTDPSQAGALTVTEEDVLRATQERGSAEAIPVIRPGFRRALNAALLRFPAFRKKGSLNDVRSRSRGASSTGCSGPDNSSEATAPSHAPSRQPSDAMRRRASHDYETEGGTTTPGKRAVESGATSPTPEGATGSRWGSRSSKREGEMRELDRSPSIQSLGGSLFSRHFMPSRQPSLREQQPDGSSDSRLVSRTASPMPAADPDVVSSGRRHFNNVFARFSGRPKTPRKSSLGPSENGVAPSAPEPAPVDDRAIYSSRRSSPPIGFFATTPDHDDSDEFEYSSDDQELGSPIAHADNVTGWQSGASHFDVLGVPDDYGVPLDLDDTHPYSSFMLSEKTPRPFDQVSTGLALDPASLSPLQLKGLEEDGTMRPGGSPQAAPRWQTYQDDDEEDGEEIFVASRRKRAVTGGT